MAPVKILAAIAFGLAMGASIGADAADGSPTVAVAARHLWIQHLPEGSVPACGATLSYLLEVFPLADVVRKVLTGSGECARITWSLLGLSMPGWVLLAAVGLGALGAYANFPGRRAPGQRA